MTKRTTLYTDDDREIALPTKWHICGSCQGHGKSSRYLGAITEDDRAPGGAWDDPEEFEDYVAGHYDRTCDECSGSGKVERVDEERLDAETLKAWRAQVEDDREYERACAAERRMGA